MDMLRTLKRRIFTAGYAKPVFDFVNETQKDTSIPTGMRAGDFVVNLSFDLEFAYNAYFWNKDFTEAMKHGKRSLANLNPTLDFLHREKVEYNAQVVGLLLDTDRLRGQYFDTDHEACVRTHEELFSLSPESIALLRTPYAEVGIHGFTHQLFNELDQDRAQRELAQAVECVRRCVYDGAEKKLFMSFPRNNIGHTNLLNAHGIYAWRSRSQSFSVDGGVPLGLWFSPNHLDEVSLARLLADIRASKQGYFLHLWNHFTEMDVATLERLVEVIRKAGWRFSSVEHYVQSRP